MPLAGGLLRLLVVLLLSVIASRAIWPLPRSVTLSSGNDAHTVGISYGFTFVVEADSALLRQAAQRYVDEFLLPLGPAPSACSARCLCSARIVVADPARELAFGVNETYQITIALANATSPAALIEAATVWGAMRAMETFAQLIQLDLATGSSVIRGVPLTIVDWPRFPWRGLMLDNSRHFLPLEAVKRHVRAIAMSKMNVFHWHLTDAQSVPLRLRNAPELLRGAYSPQAAFTVEQMREVVEYARSFGVRVVPELDMPSHVRAWGAGYPFAVVNCPTESFDMQPFDPTNPALYELLDRVFGELRMAFTDPWIHIGGDEVKTRCWDTNPAISAWMRARSIANGEALWRYFAERLRGILEKHGWSRFVMWFEMLEHRIDFGPISATLTHVWMDSNMLVRALDAGRPALLSAGYYLDQQNPNNHFPLNYLWADTWVTFWRNDPAVGARNDAQRALVQGGEACAWGEQVDGVNVDGRVWPRAAGAAERFWSPHAPGATGGDPGLIQEARTRIMQFRCRLAQLGIRAGPVSPDYCPLMAEPITATCAPAASCTCSDKPPPPFVPLGVSTAIVAAPAPLPLLPSLPCPVQTAKAEQAKAAWTELGVGALMLGRGYAVPEYVISVLLAAVVLVAIAIQRVIARRAAAPPSGVAINL